MGKINVEGLGVVEIAGDTPTEAETAIIINAIRAQKPQSEAAVPPAAVPPAAVPPAAAPALPPILQPAAQASPISAIEPLSGSRGAAIAAGSMLGATVGAPVLPPVGSLVGGGLGAALGYLGYENIRDFQDALGIAPKNLKRPDLTERVKRAAEEAAYDVGFGAAAQFIRPLDFLKRVGTKALGVGREQQREIFAASIDGVRLGLQDVSRFELVRNAKNVIGRMPLIGGPFKTAQQRKFLDVTRAQEDLVDRLGPIVGQAEQGANINQAAQKGFKAFQGEANRLYGNYRKLAEEKNIDFDTAALTDYAKSLRKAIRSNLPTKRIKKDGVVQERAITKGLTESDQIFLSLVSDIAKLSPTQKIGQLDSLAGRVNNLIGFAKANRNKTIITPLLDLKKQIETTLRAAPDQEVAKSLKAADDFFSKARTTFETATAKKFGRVNRNMFDVGFETAGSLEPDEIRRIIFNTTSPDSLVNLRKLLGPDARPIFEAAARDRIDEAFEAGIANVERQGFDKQAFLKKLNLDKPKMSRKEARTPTEEGRTELAERRMSGQATEELLKGLQVSPEQLSSFAALAEKALAGGVPDVSTFVARRAVLGGLRSAVRSFTPFAAAGGGALVTDLPLLKSIVGVVVARRANEVLTNPALAQTLDEIMQARTKPRLARQAFAKLPAQLQPDTEELEAQGL